MIRWYFDFISPYAYLQSTRLEKLSQYGEVECVPVLFAGLLDHFDNIGPAEVAPKRDWTFKRVAYLAHREGIELTLPPHHPFNPLPLLRLSVALKNDIPSVMRLFRFVWAEGKLPEGDNFSALLKEVGVSEDQLTNGDVKQALHTNGSSAADNGIFGVPTIDIDGELFWGHDATDMALDFLNQKDWPDQAMANARALPQGISRKPRNRKPNWENTSDGGTRLPLLPIDFKEPADLVAAIRKRRGGELIELDRLLLYSTPLAEGWNALIGNVRNSFTVSKQLRELAICTIAVVNGAYYEYKQHAPIYIQNGGDQQRADALQDLANISKHLALFDQREQLVVALSEKMTRDIKVDEGLFEKCRQTFSETELVEIILQYGIKVSCST